MTIKPEDFAKTGADFSLFFANTAFDAFESLVLLNMATARSVFELSLSNLNALLGAKDVQSLVAVQKSLAGPSLEKGIDYSRKVIDIAADTKSKLTKEVEAKVATANAQVGQIVEKALAAAPAGSEVAVAAVKSAIKSAGEALEGINKAAKQVAQVAEASVSTATEATLKAASAAQKAA